MPCLLLDFDGVILRNHRISNIIVNRCQSMVHKCIKHLDFESCKRINKNLYESTGHTVLGLQRLGYKDLLISEFDELVYQKIDYKVELSDISSTHASDIENVKNLYNYCKTKGIDMWIFSNAPDSWCHSISHMMDLPILPSTRPHVSTLKPDPKCYLEIERKIKSDKYIFVDDKMMNLMKAPDHWTCVWMSDLQQDVSDNFSVIKSMKNLKPILDEHLT